MDPAARIAARQHGVAARWQLRAAGLSARAIEYRIEIGRLHPVHRGIYLVGHSVFCPFGREAAALLACGRAAVLSHVTAAAIWGIVEEWPARVDVTIVGRDCRARPGLRVHRTRELGRRELRVRHGLVVTSPPLTLLDLAGVVGERELRRVVNEAQVLQLVRERDLLPLLDRFSRRRGTRRLRTLLERQREPAITRSEAERRMLELIERAELPRPQVNARVTGFEVDFLWPAAWLVVEVDGFVFHSSAAAFERDRRRDAELAAAGFRVVRVTWRQLVDEPEALAVRLARVL